MLSPAQVQQYQDQGYVVAEGLFSPTEVAAYRDHYMTLTRYNRDPLYAANVDPTSQDPLKRYPRMLQMHRWDEVSLQWLIEPRLNRCLTALLGREPYAVQTMIYYKPAGSRGQALHQDNFYLKAEPGTCIAAWMALDRADEENGCMRVAPGSHRWPILCTIKADTQVSFTDVTVPLPPEAEVQSVIMEPGDVLFFHGALVHGSLPNTSADRFRRSLIAHYIEGDARQVARSYHPALRMDGTPLPLDISPTGGPCGVWVERDGTVIAEMSGEHSVYRKHE